MRTTRDTDQGDLLALVDEVIGDLPQPLTAAAVVQTRRALADAGLWSLGIPESAGGGGADEAMLGLVVARVASRSAALAVSLVQAHAAAGALAGDPARSDQLAAIVAGDLGAAAVEAGHRLDPDGAAHEGTRVDLVGDLGLVVVLQGGAAAVIRPDGTARELPTTGFDGGRTLLLPAGPQDSEPLDGVDTGVVRRLLAVGALAAAAGVATAAAAQATSYAAGRVQFGGPIADLPTVRASLDGQARVAGQAWGDVLSAGSFTLAEVVEAALDAGERAIDVCADALQCHGGYGYLAEYPAERLLRDAVSLRAWSPAGAIARSLAGAMA
ncbi:acyl-CoA dehydrogenase family protein [Nocardioides hungaricus]